MTEPTATKSTFELVNQLITSISQLLWPITLFVLILLFRKDISILLHRLKKGKILGQEIELSDEIDKFKEVTKDAVESLPVDVKVASFTVMDNTLEEILTKAADDPKIAIILLATEIEKEIRSFIASTGLLSEIKVITIKPAFDLLVERKFIPSSLQESVAIFWDLRNKIIHGKKIEDDGQLIRVLDIGVQLLNTLKSMPHGKHFVNQLLDLFSDPSCTAKIDGVIGVFLETKNEKGTLDFKIFPSRKKNYKVGMQVTWEWSFEKIWEETWYINPHTHKPRMAWQSAAEFVGRSIDDI